MRKAFWIAILISLHALSTGQDILVDHWETIVYADDTVKYLIGEAEPPANWNELSFEDSTWLAGKGGIGYGDDDDNTELQDPVISVFIRKSFEVVDKSVIKKVILNADYDDAFVAYLNGIEIARANIGLPGDRPAYNQPHQLDGFQYARDLYTNW